MRSRARDDVQRRRTTHRLRVITAVMSLITIGTGLASPLSAGVRVSRMESDNRVDIGGNQRGGFHNGLHVDNTATLSLPAVGASGSSHVKHDFTLLNASSSTPPILADDMSLTASGTISATGGAFDSLGLASFQVNFELDGIHGYALSLSDFFIQPPPTVSDSRTFARLRLEGNGALHLNRFINSTSDITFGSFSGTLPAGLYQLIAELTVEGRSGTRDGKYNFGFMLERPILWANAASGDFQTGGNWSSGAPPSGSDFAVINLPGTYTVSLAGNAAHKRLHVTGDGAHVTLDLEGNRYRLDELHLGDPSGNFSFTLSDSSGPVSVPPGDSGPWPAPGTGEAEITILTTDGPGRTDITAKTISQTGLIENGHIVNVLADGDWRVKDLTVGDEDPADLMISGGGKVNSSFPIIGKRVRGILNSTRGKVTVAGGGGLVSKFDALEMIVGDDGKGELEINAGGEVSAADIHVGKESNGVGVVTVDGPGARLRQNHDLGDLVIGAQGKGTLNVLNDARVFAEGIFRIGAGAGGSSDGIVNVTHHGDIAADRLVVGNQGKGTFNVVDGGSADTGPAVIGPQGKVTVADGGFLIVNPILTVNGELSVNTTGTALVANAASLSIPSGKLTIGPGGTLKGNGTIRANVNFAGGIPQFTGSRLAPANSAGTLTIEGDVVQEPGSAMEIEIGGIGAGQFDVLKVTGNATLGGEVFLKFTDGFAPRQGNQFEFIDVSGTLAGAFANVQIRNLAPGFQFDVHALAGGGGMAMVALNDGVFMLPASSAWNVDASGNWSSVANWTVGDPNSAGVTAVLGNKITAPRTVTIDAPATVGRIDFDNANAYTVAGDETLTLDATTGAAQINVASGSHIISAPLSLADNTVITVSPAASNLSITEALIAADVTLTKAGQGTLTVDNIQGAGLSITDGKVVLAPNGGVSVLNSLLLGEGVQAIPEPATLALLAVGLFLVCAPRLQRAKKRIP